MTKQFIINEKGHKTGVLIGIKEYEQLQHLIEEYEDALDLKKAVHEADGFTDYQKIREQLKAKGKL